MMMIMLILTLMYYYRGHRLESQLRVEGRHALPEAQAPAQGNDNKHNTNNNISSIVIISYTYMIHNIL